MNEYSTEFSPRIILSKYYEKDYQHIQHLTNNSYLDKLQRNAYSLHFFFKKTLRDVNETD